MSARETDLEFFERLVDGLKNSNQSAEDCAEQLHKLACDGGVKMAIDILKYLSSRHTLANYGGELDFLIYEAKIALSKFET